MCLVEVDISEADIMFADARVCGHHAGREYDPRKAPRPRLPDNGSLKAFGPGSEAIFEANVMRCRAPRMHENGVRRAERARRGHSDARGPR